jgi:hypothetical protein
VIFLKKKASDYSGSFTRSLLFRRLKPAATIDYLPRTTITSFTDPATWGGIGKEAGWPFKTTDLTPFCTPEGFSTLMLYVAPRHCRTTSNPFQWDGMQGFTIKPLKEGWIPSMYLVAAVYIQPAEPVSQGWRARPKAVWSLPIMNWQYD